MVTLVVAVNNPVGLYYAGFMKEHVYDNDIRPGDANDVWTIKTARGHPLYSEAGVWRVEKTWKPHIVEHPRVARV